MYMYVCASIHLLYYLYLVMNQTTKNVPLPVVGSLGLGDPIIGGLLLVLSQEFQFDFRILVIFSGISDITKGNLTSQQLIYIHIC